MELTGVARDVIPLCGLVLEGSELVDVSVDPALTDNTVRVTRRDSVTLRVTVRKADGTLKDLTGYGGAFAMMVRADDADADAVLDLRTAGLSGGADTKVKVLTQTGADLGVLEVYLTPALMVMVPRSYVYSVTVLLSTTKRYAVIPFGKFVVMRALVESIT